MLNAILRMSVSTSLALLAVIAPNLRAQDQTTSQNQPAAANAKSQTKDPGAQTTSEKQSATSEANTETEKDTSGKTHFRLGTVTIGASYTHYPASFVRPFWPYGYPYAFGYSPFFFYDPFYYPYYYPSLYAPYLPGLGLQGFAFDEGKGQVRLAAEPKTAEVRLDGALAGTAENLKSMWLAPGAYDLTVSAPGRGEFHERIYVLSGKTVKIKATLLPQSGQPKSQDKDKGKD